MIVKLETLTSMPEFKDVDSAILQRKLNGIEHLIRAYTNNNFQNRAVRFEAQSSGAELTADDRFLSVLPFLKEGDTVEISQSTFGVNDGLYVVQSVKGDIVTVDRDLFPVESNLVTKVVYPEDVQEGVINLLQWEIENRQKVGIKQETISRHSVTYYDQDANNQVMGYPVALLGFLSPYIKARF